VFTHKIGAETHVDVDLLVYAQNSDEIQTYWEEFLTEMEVDYNPQINQLSFLLLGEQGSIHFKETSFRLDYGNVHITYDVEYLLDSMEDVLTEARRLWYENNHPT